MSVGAPFFNIAFTPFMVLLALLLPVGALLPWRKNNKKAFKPSLYAVAAVSIALGSMVWSLQTGGRFLAPIGASLALWVILGTFYDLNKRIKVLNGSLVVVLIRLSKVPRSDLGKSFAHMGFGLMIFGISAVSAWEVEDIRVTQLNEPYKVQDYTIELIKVSQFSISNYVTRQGEILVKKNEKTLTTLFPEKRFYPVQETATTEASIDSNIFRDIYIVLGDRESENSWVVRTYVKPFIIWIWIGAFTIATGGIISLTDRRYRLASIKNFKYVDL